MAIPGVNGSAEAVSRVSFCVTRMSVPSFMHLASKQFVPGLLSLTVILMSLAVAQENAPRPQGDATRGKELFDGTCLQCHDVEGKERKNGPSLQGLKSGKLRDGRKATHDLLLQIINTGPGYMPAFKDYLSEQKKEDLVAYMMAL
jgi:mono/diheme cytochrome c family protein